MVKERTAARRLDWARIWTVSLTLLILVALGTIIVVASRWPERSDTTMGSAPEQVYLRTGAERRFLDELSLYVHDVGAHERDYLDLAHAWCRQMRGGALADDAAHSVLVRSSQYPELFGSSRLVIDVATLRMCPEQSARLDAHYGGK